MSERYESLHIDGAHESIRIIVLDVPDRPVNVLTPQLLDELDEAIDELGRDADVEGIVIASAKDDFLAGADIDMLAEARSSEELTAISRRAQEVFARVAAAPKPVVAAIGGACLGGGLELAMACSRRVAADDRDTKLGQPEVRLGLIPGAGGTVRLPLIVGLEQALEMLLQGRELSADDAQQVGLVDEVVPRPILRSVAAEHARRAVGHEEGDGLDRSSTWARLMTRNRVSRRIVLQTARKRTQARTRGNYPAASTVIDVVETGLRDGPDAGLAAEAEAFGRLGASATGRELMRMFRLRQALRKRKPVDAEPRALQRVGVLGVGKMGAEIAYVTASEAGLAVRLCDQDHQRIAEALAWIDELFDKGLRHDKLEPMQARRAANGVTTTLDAADLSGCDLVIEAVPEKLELKKSLLAQVEGATRKEVIFATNTSSIPIARLAEASRQPQNVVGLHYFSPVVKMPLVEVVAGADTSPEVVATCVELAKRQGKVPIVVSDGPGFYTTRILAAYLGEACRILADGVEVTRIDEALEQFGFAVGPFALVDEVGLPVAVGIQDVLEAELGERMHWPRLLDKLVDEGRDGAAGGLGFYEHGDEGREHDPAVYRLLGIELVERPPSAHEIAWRCVLMMVNEAARCLEDGIVHSADDGDAAAVFGLAFPPFLGGPFRLVQRCGREFILDRFERFREEHGERFRPTTLLEQSEIFETTEAPEDEEVEQVTRLAAVGERAPR